jgi:hypothetical protein
MLYNQNIRTLSIIILKKIRSLRNWSEKLAFLSVSNAGTNQIYIFRQCTYIVHVSTKLYQEKDITYTHVNTE